MESRKSLKKKLDLILQSDRKDCECCKSGGCNRPWSPSCPKYKGGARKRGRCKKFSGSKKCIKWKGRCAKYSGTKKRAPSKKRSDYNKFVSKYFKENFVKGQMSAPEVMKAAAAAYKNGAAPVKRESRASAAPDDDITWHYPAGAPQFSSEPPDVYYS